MSLKHIDKPNLDRSQGRRTEINRNSLRDLRHPHQRKDLLMLHALMILAEAASTPEGSEATHVRNAMALNNLLAAVVFAAIGVVVFLFVFWLIVKITPFSFRKEIEEDQNTSLAIIVGSVMIGIAIIIAAAIRG